MRTNHTKAIELRSYHRRRLRHLVMDLTAHGSVRRRTSTLMESERPEHYRKQNLAKYHSRAQRRAASGLNSRGRQYRTRVFERAWHRLKSEMEVSK